MEIGTDTDPRIRTGWRYREEVDLVYEAEPSNWHTLEVVQEAENRSV